MSLVPIPKFSMRCYLIVLCCSPLMVSGQTYEAVGVWNFRSYLGGKAFAERIYDFKMIVNDGRWTLNATMRERKKQGVLQTTNNFDYVQAAFDGQQCYTVTLVETFTRQNPNSETSNVAIGTIESGSIPIRADLFIKDLWLGFASDRYFESTKGDWFYPLYIKPDIAESVDDRLAIKGRWSPLPNGGLPASAIFTFEFDRKLRDGRQSTEEWIKHTNIVFTVDQFTNINSFAVPTHFTKKSFSAKGAALVTEVEVTATISPSSSRSFSFVPTLPGETCIVDSRLTNFHEEVSYKATNWLTVKQAQAAAIKRIPVARKIN